MLTYPQCSSAIGDLVFSPYVPPCSRMSVGGPTALLNVQKLRLPLDTALATQVSVTDGFVVSGFGDARDGFYFWSDADGGYLQSLPYVSLTDIIINVNTADPPRWRFIAAGGVETVAGDSTSDPWDSTWPDGATLTHPAVQQLAAPGRGALLVSGSSQDGVYVTFDTHAGRPTLKLLGSTPAGFDGPTTIAWDDTWYIYDADSTPVYYSIQDVATPDLVTEWRYATPAMQVSGGTVDGVWEVIGALDGKSVYALHGSDGAMISGHVTTWEDQWKIFDAYGGDPIYYSLEDVATPDLVTAWLNAVDNSPASITVTAQPVAAITVALTDPQAGVAVLGGTQDGVYPMQSSLFRGKPWYFILGGGSAGTDDVYTIGWANFNISGDPFDGWLARDNGGNPLYYSLSDVATPDLASNWKNATDDSPAAITVTSVSQGELDAGLFVTNDGITNGSSYVSQPFHGRQYYMGLNGGGSNNLHWDTDYNVWTDDVGVWTADNVAFPWQGTDNHTGHNGATFSRNDVATEANWTNV